MKNLNVIEHEMVPEHFIMSDEEVHELLARYSIELKQLPKISVTDPACKDIAAKKDDVIRIKRRSLTAGEAVSYRLVIDTKLG
jgi:DNA-directed RNA polymerase subunit H